MITLVIALLVILIVAGLLIWAVDMIAGALPLPAPVPVLIKVIIVVLACLLILERSGVFNTAGLR